MAEPTYAPTTTFEPTLPYDDEYFDDDEYDMDEGDEFYAEYVFADDDAIQDLIDELEMEKDRLENKEGDDDDRLDGVLDQLEAEIELLQEKNELEEELALALELEEDVITEPDPVLTLPPTLPPTPQPYIREQVQTSASVKQDSTLLHTVGFQSNWGPYTTYSGSMIYDFTRNSIYITGTTYEQNRLQESVESKLPRSSCFVGHIPMANLQQWKAVDDPLPPQAVLQVGARQKIADPDFLVPDNLDKEEQMGCHSILYDSSASTKAGGDYLYVSGVDESNMDGRKGKIKGFVNVYDRTREKPEWTNQNLASVALANPSAISDVSGEKIPVRYPVGMVHGYSGGKDAVIAVLSVSSNDNLLTDPFVENDDRGNPTNYKNSLLPPGVGAKGNRKHHDYYKRGSNFFPSFQTFSITGEGTRRTPKMPVFGSGTDLVPPSGADPDKNNIFPTGIINLDTNGQHYVIAGSYQGLAPVLLKGFESTNVDDNDYDGFAASIKYPSGRPTWLPTIRFSSMETTPNLDDFVHDVCDGPADGSSYYVVGSSYGTMPKGLLQADYNIVRGDGTMIDNRDEILSSWVSKIEAETLTVLWTTQIYSTDHNEAFGCHVIPSDPSTMYVGGTVFNAGHLVTVRSGFENKIQKNADESVKSYGNDDVFVAQLQTEDGSLKWIKQLGSSGEDHISRTNGVQADSDGDCIIYGDTNGELYRSRTTGGNGPNSVGTDIFVVKLDKRDGNYISTIENDRNSSSSARSGTSSAGKKVGISVGVTLLIVSLCMLCCIYYKFRRPKRRNKNASGGDDGLFTDGVMTSFRDNDASDPMDDAIGIDDDGNYHDKKQNDPSTTTNGGDGGGDNNSSNNNEIADAITKSYNDKNGNGRPNPVSSTYSDDVPPSHPHGKLDDITSSIGGGKGSNDNDLDQTAFQDDPDYRPGRNFV